jgi:hypothetical protein
MWRLRIWQHPTIGRVLARATRRALTSKAGANTGPTAGLGERSNAVCVEVVEGDHFDECLGNELRAFGVTRLLRNLSLRSAMRCARDCFVI